MKHKTVPAICLREEMHPGADCASALLHRQTYISLGEVTVKDKYNGRTGHIILLDLSSGQILPGMHHPESFRRVTDEDEFF